MDSQHQQQQSDKTNTTKYKILILGASYGSLLATKILMAGHDVTLICRESTAVLFNQHGSIVLMPIKGGSDNELLEIRSKDLPGTLTACTPESILLESSTTSGGSDSLLTSRFDLAVLAMQEPQYSAPGVRELVIRIAQDALPTMAITNMPLIPYLKRIIIKNNNDDNDNKDNIFDAIRSCFTEPDLWTTHFQNPDLLTQCSPDPQAFRPNADTQPNVLQVRLPTNFKAAKFANPDHTQMLQRLEHDIEAARYKGNVSASTLQIQVKLRVHDSLFVPLAKWAMLLTGNYRCVQPFPAEMVSIQHAVMSNLAESRTVYDWVVQVCMDLGGNDDNNNNNNNTASLDDFVPFEKYAAAAKSLTSPSSAARALAAGATNIERVDKLVLLLATQQGKEINATVMATVAAVDEWLVQNQNQKKKKQAAAAAEPASTK